MTKCCKGFFRLLIWLFKGHFTHKMSFLKLWIASATHCGFLDTRCPISFGSKAFVDGTYDSSNDLCYPNTTIDELCAHGGVCQKSLRGLCALAPVKEVSQTSSKCNWIFSIVIADDLTDAPCATGSGQLQTRFRWTDPRLSRLWMGLWGGIWRNLWAGKTLFNCICKGEYNKIGPFQFRRVHRVPKAPPIGRVPTRTGMAPHLTSPSVPHWTSTRSTSRSTQPTRCRPRSSTMWTPTSRLRSWPAVTLRASSRWLTMPLW